jgi:hypothetical protein
MIDENQIKEALRTVVREWLLAHAEKVPGGLPGHIHLHLQVGTVVIGASDRMTALALARAAQKTG